MTIRADTEPRPSYATRNVPTVELCDHARDGARCTRDKNHDGPHELLSVRAGLYVEPRDP